MYKGSKAVAERAEVVVKDLRNEVEGIERGLRSVPVLVLRVLSSIRRVRPSSAELFPALSQLLQHRELPSDARWTQHCLPM